MTSCRGVKVVDSDFPPDVGSLDVDDIPVGLLDCISLTSRLRSYAPGGYTVMLACVLFPRIERVEVSLVEFNFSKVRWDAEIDEAL